MLALAAALLLQAPVDDLIRGLRDDAPAAREDAFRGLVEGWERWSSADLATLRAAGEDPDLELAGRARAALVRIDVRRRVGPPAPGLLEAIDERLPSVAPERRLEILKAAGRLAEEGQLQPRVLDGLVALIAEHRWPLPGIGLLELVGSKRETRDAKPFLPLVAGLLAEPDPQTAAGAAGLLARHGAVEHYARVLPLLAEPSGRYASVCIDVLGNTETRGLAPRVAELAAADAQPVRLAAAEILGRMGAHAHASVLARRLGPGTAADELRVLAGALGLMAAREHAEAVASLLGHEDRDVRAAAANAAGRLGDPALGPRLAALLKDRETDVRQAAADGLAMLKPASAVPELVPLLTDRDAVVRGYAAQALGAIGAKSEARPILAVLAHDHPWSRAQALRALGRLGAVDQAGEMERLLDDEWNLVRIAAALGIAELRSASAPALDGLRALRKDPTEEVRDAALVALARHDGADALAAADGFTTEAVEVLADGLAARHEKDARARLLHPIEIAKPIDSKERLVEVLAAAGFRLENARDLQLHGRIPDGLRLSPRDLVARCWPNVLAVPDGARLLVLSPPSAVAHWRTKLATR